MADIVQHLLIPHGRGLRRRDQLRLEAGALPVLAEMLRDVEGLGVDGLPGLAQRIHARKLALEVGLLLVGQPGADLIEPVVDDVPGELLLDQATFVEQRHHRTIGHGLIDGVFVDEPAEGGERVFLLLQQRRAGEAQVAGLGEQPAHLGGELAVPAISARLRAMAFIHQHEDVPVAVGSFVAACRAVELVDDGGDQRCLVAYQFDQMRAAGCPHRFHIAGLEGALDLLVQVVSVGDDDDARVGDGLIQRQCAAEHHHGQ